MQMAFRHAPPGMRKDCGGTRLACHPIGARYAGDPPLLLPQRHERTAQGMDSVRTVVPMVPPMVSSTRSRSLFDPV